MKPELLLDLDPLLKDIRRLTSRLLDSKIPFALWRKPQSAVSYVLISLHEEYPLDRIQQIDDLSDSFLINSFQNSHPPQPWVISGDIVIQIQQDKKEVKINPMVSSDQMEAFFEKVNLRKIRSENNGSATNEIPPNYAEMVQRALDEIEKGTLHKVVLARTKEIELTDSFNSYDLFLKLLEKYTNAFVYLQHTDRFGTWIGATPERLISVKNKREFITDSLAGTQPLNENQALSEVTWTMKEIEEQAMVSRYIIECFKKIRLREYLENGPKTIKAGNIAHLKTEFRVDMIETNALNLPSTMLELLHPTSAVCGFPRNEALQFINENEGFDRELYAGFLGPVNFEEETNLFVNLRCMKVLGTTARLFAGAGITSGSHPIKEFEETELKLNTLLSVLGQ